MHDSVESFLNHLRTERQASMHTVRSYEDDLALYSSYLAEFQGDRGGSHGCGLGPIAAILRMAFGAGLRVEHVAHRLASLRSSSASCAGKGW